MRVGKIILSNLSDRDSTGAQRGPVTLPGHTAGDRRFPGSVITLQHAAIFSPGRGSFIEGGVHANQLLTHPQSLHSCLSSMRPGRVRLQAAV